MRHYLTLVISVFVLFATFTYAHYTIGQPGNPPPACNLNDCTAPDKWFADGKTPKVGPDDYPLPNDDECAFYKFAWQSFLYLTQPENPGEEPRFVLFDTPNDLFDTRGGKLQVTAAPVREPAKHKVLSLSVRNSPDTTRKIEAKAVEQAGSHGVLIDRNNRCLYYGQHINGDYVNFIRNTLGIKSVEQLKTANADKGFPEGCVELKSSWRVLTDAEKQPDVLNELRKSFFITEADVPTLSEDTDSAGNKSIKAHAETPRHETVALVALHVVGTTPGHPEFVWASFEHVNNAPTPPKLPLGGNDVIDANKDFTFYRKNTMAKDCNVNPVPDDVRIPAVPLAFLNQQNQTLVPIVDIYREFNSGSDGFGLDDDVCTINKSVQSKLAAIPTLSVWSNYQLIGAVWLKTPDTDFVAGKSFPYPPPPPATPDMFAGEQKLSNAVMETFTQHKQVNCFGCHDTSPVINDNGLRLPGLKIRVSHVIRNAFLGAD